MRNLEQIVDQLRSHTGADFAFVLTRKGRLATHRAPREMPEEGRARLVRAAHSGVSRREIVEVTMPREELVPYGGAAPVDVYVAMAAEQAIVCVVMATWSEKGRIASGLRACIEIIEPLLLRGIPPQRKSDLPPARGSRWVPPRMEITTQSSLPPPSEWTTADSCTPQEDAAISSSGEIPRFAHLTLPRIDTEPPPSAQPESTPDITISEAALGRRSLAAVEKEFGREPASPEIVVGTAELGRESLAAIHSEQRAMMTSSPDLIRVELESLPDLSPKAIGRSTMPWVELPEDTKRALDAARTARRQSPPAVSVKFEEVEVPLNDDADDTMGVPRVRP